MVKRHEIRMLVPKDHNKPTGGIATCTLLNVPTGCLYLVAEYSVCRHALDLQPIAELSPAQQTAAWRAEDCKICAAERNSSE